MLRLACATAPIFVVESVVFGLVVLPAVAFFRWHTNWSIDSSIPKTVVLAMAAVPSYAIFIVLLRAGPVWSWCTRFNGARLGRRVWVNGLGVTNHCLLDFGDDEMVPKFKVLADRGTYVGVPVRPISRSATDHEVGAEEHDG